MLCFRWMIASLLLTLSASTMVAAQEETPPPKNKPAKPAKQVAMNEAETAFAKLLTGAELVGTFTVDGRTGTPKEDRYTIARAEKVKDGKWMIHARVKYGDVNVVVPVPVRMDWAGDTPVLSVTDLSIPLLGSDFDTRLLFDGERYAGTWAHGKVGGHMWGRIERAKPENLESVTEEKPDARPKEKIDETEKK